MLIPHHFLTPGSLPDCFSSDLTRRPERLTLVAEHGHLRRRLGVRIMTWFCPLFSLGPVANLVPNPDEYSG